MSRKEEAYQKKKCKSIGFLLLIPALGMIGNGIGLIFLAHPEIPIHLSYGTIGILAVMTVGLSAHIFVFRKDSSLAARFLRFTDCAALSSPVSLIVLLALLPSSGEDTAVIGCMSAVLLGVMAFLIAVNLIVISFCDYKNTRESIKTISNLMHSKKLTISRAMLVKDSFLVAGKFLISLASLSFFMFANGLYSVGVGVGRYIAIRMHTHNREDQMKSYRMVGVVILLSSVCYVLYSIRLFFGGKTVSYPMVIALVIALYTFIEFGINVREVIRLRKSRALEAKALRMLSFSSTLLCFVLTQTAIMSFAHEGDTNFFNALSGVVFGGGAALIGLYMIITVKRQINEM